MYTNIIMYFAASPGHGTKILEDQHSCFDGTIIHSRISHSDLFNINDPCLSINIAMAALIFSCIYI